MSDVQNSKSMMVGKINDSRFFEVDDLIRLIGQERFGGEAPLSAFKAEVVFKAGEVVNIVWHCHARRDILERLAPDLLARNSEAGE